MNDPHLSLRNRYVLVAMLLGLAWLAYLILRDYLTILASSFLIAYMLLPLKKKCDAKMDRRISALIAVAILAVALFIVVSLAAGAMVAQLGPYLNQAHMNEAFNQAAKYLSYIPPQFSGYVQTVRQQAGAVAISVITRLISSIPTVTVSVFMTLFITYFLVLDFDRIRRFIMDLLFIEHKDRLADIIGATSRHIIYGYSGIALLEFGVSLVGFWLAGSPLYLVLAFITGLSAFVPVIGPFSIWFPAMLFYLASGQYLQAVVMLVMGLLITVVIDHFIGYLLVGRGARVHPVIMLLGVLGGIPLYGVLGFILGPLTLVIFIETANAIVTP